jgi:hypothetical protein
MGTAGDRIALERVVCTGGSEGSPFETEIIRLTEIDADGKLAAQINWDVEDRSAAFLDAHARFVAGEAASIGGQAPILALDHALARRDAEATRAAFRRGRDHPRPSHARAHCRATSTWSR